MWHKIWDTAASFHQRYIRPVWIRVHYSKLHEVIDDDVEIEDFYKNGGDRRSHLAANSQVVVHYGSTSCVNKFTTTNTTSFPRSTTSLKNEEFDQVDAGFYRPIITFPVVESVAKNNENNSEYSLCPTSSTTDSVFKGSSSSVVSSCLKNSTVTDLKHAIQFQSKIPSYRLVQEEEADRIEIISIDHNSSSTNSSSKRRDSDKENRKINHLLQQQQQKQNNHHHHHNHHHQSISSSSQNINVEEIIQSSSNNNVVVTKKSKSRRKKVYMNISKILADFPKLSTKAFKRMKKIAGWTWKSLRQGLYAAPSFIMPQTDTSIYAMATKYKVYFG